MFDITFKADAIKPVLMKSYDSVITLVFDKGVLAQAYNKFKILIPYSSLIEQGFEYDVENNSYKKPPKEYKIGDSIYPNIINIRYDKNGFSCIGSL